MHHLLWPECIGTGSHRCAEVCSHNALTACTRPYPACTPSELAALVFDPLPRFGVFRRPRLCLQDTRHKARGALPSKKRGGGSTAMNLFGNTDPYAFAASPY